MPPPLLYLLTIALRTSALQSESQARETKFESLSNGLLIVLRIVFVIITEAWLDIILELATYLHITMVNIEI